MRESRNIAVALLREPANPARTEIDDEELDSLCRSIRDVGLIEPLIVKPLDDGSFEVIAGHRRLLALRRVGAGEAECVIDTRSELAAAVKAAENLEREEWNAVDEGIFYWEQFEALGQDVERVADVVKRSRTYVEGRMNLVRGWPDVIEALKKRQIAVGVAEAFNKIKLEADVKYYLGFASNGGVSVRTARQWAAEANLRAELQAKAPAQPLNGGATGDPVATPSSIESRVFAGAMPYELSSGSEPRPCLCCGETWEEYRMLRKFICPPCVERYVPQSQRGPQRPLPMADREAGR